MQTHGVQLGLEAREYDHLGPQAQTSSGYRNLFGDADRDGRYKGLADRDKSREMFRWLSGRFGQSYAWPNGADENAKIPAGYTYLAQFVIHDTVQSLADLPDVESGKDWLRNDRSGRLILDGIYGKGMSADPLLYGICPAFPAARGFLRIGGREGDDPVSYRDLPRVPCPFSGKWAYADVLIADSRNDDNLIIAQLTALFHLLHNIVYSELNNLYQNKYTDRFIFSIARKAVTFIYRKVVIEDFLKRVLYPEVYEEYKNRGREALVDDPNDSRMPLEFSHAAARFGHFMVRDHYEINSVLRDSDTGLRSMLTQTSASRPWAMPLDGRWLIEWKRLFGPPGTAGLLYSRRLGPELARVLVQPDLLRDQLGGVGSLPYVDFVRGSESNLRSLSGIVNHPRFPGYVREASPLLLRDNEVDTQPIIEWLETPILGMPQLPREYVNLITQDVPLLLFVMFEAAKTVYPRGNVKPKDILEGECLGPMGSFIIAEFIFGEYWRTHELIENDAATQEAVGKIFGQQVPGSMPTLIDEIARRKGWDGADARFW